MNFLIKGPWLNFAYTEIGGGGSFASLNNGMKVCCASASTRGTHVFEQCCHYSEGFMKVQLMQRGAREREARFLQFTLQLSSDLLYIPHLLAHAVSNLHTGSPRFLSGSDAEKITNQQFYTQTLDQYTFGVRRGKWHEFFRYKNLSSLRD